MNREKQLGFRFFRWLWIAVFCSTFWSNSSTAQDSYLLIAVIQNQDKTTSIHNVAVTKPQCDRLLKLFNESGPFILKLPVPNGNAFVSGMALELHCILPDGSIIGPYGKESKDSLNLAPK